MCMLATIPIPLLASARQDCLAGLVSNRSLKRQKESPNQYPTGTYKGVSQLKPTLEECRRFIGLRSLVP
jgi:hypothetical protein